MPLLPVYVRSTVLTAIAASIGAAVAISTLFDFVKLIAELTVIPGKSVSRG